MILNLMVTWRTMFWLFFLIGLVLGSLLSPTGGLLVVSWWVEAGQKAGPLIWQASRPVRVDPPWWRGVGWAYRWGCRGVLVGLSWWLWASLGSDWVWLGWVVMGPGGVESRWLWQVGSVLAGIVKQEQPALVAPPAPVEVEVTLDLEPLLAELSDMSPGEETGLTAREALIAQIERIRAVCFQHPVSQVLPQQVEAEVQRVVKRVGEEALGQELDEYLGGARPNPPTSIAPAVGIAPCGRSGGRWRSACPHCGEGTRPGPGGC